MFTFFVVNCDNDFIVEKLVHSLIQFKTQLKCFCQINKTIKGGKTNYVINFNSFGLVIFGVNFFFLFELKLNFVPELSYFENLSTLDVMQIIIWIFMYTCKIIYF